MRRLTPLPPQHSLMHVAPLAKIFFYVAAVILLACLLSPPLYWAVQSLGTHGVFPSLAAQPFHRIFSRTWQILAVVLLIPLLPNLQIRSLRELGLERNPRRWRDLGLGLLAAVLPVALLAGGYLFFDVYRMKKSLELAGFLKIVPTAVLVAVAEEFLFRGLLLGLAVRAFGAAQGLMAISVIFAGIHFLRSAKEAPAGVTWSSGFHEAAGVVAGMPSWPLLSLGVISLFLAGIILGGAAVRTHSLWLSIGCHGGWIFAQQTLQLLAKYRVKPPEAFLPWVGPNLISGAVPTGLAPIGAILLTGLVIWLYLRHDPARWTNRP